MNVRILLLQARRSDDQARLDERLSIAVKTQLPEANIVPWDLLSAAPTLADVRAYDALMVGGSGEFYVSKGNLPHMAAVLDTMRAVVAVGHPTFASCFGFHMLVAALGGEVVHDPANMEVGTYELTLAPAGRADALFGALPDRFCAQLGHKDQAVRLPAGVLNLASSDLTPYQALRVPDQPIWATQFHPELSMGENLKRFRQYQHVYADLLGPVGLQERLAAFRESPETDALMRRFLELVFA